MIGYTWFFGYQRAHSYEEGVHVTPEDGVARYSIYVPRVPRAVQFVHRMFTLGSQRIKKAFRN